MNTFIYIILLTLVPFFELRASIPYGIITLGQESWLAVFIVAVIVNMVLGIFLYSFFNTLIRLVTKIKIFKNMYDRHVLKAQKKIKRGIVKYGIISLAIFIGIPLPGTGSYSGAIVANLLGMKKKQFFLANAIGVLMAGAIVTAVMLTGGKALNIFIK